MSKTTSRICYLANFYGEEDSVMNHDYYTAYNVLLRVTITLVYRGSISLSNQRSRPSCVGIAIIMNTIDAKSLNDILVINFANIFPMTKGYIVQFKVKDKFEFAWKYHAFRFPKLGKRLGLYLCSVILFLKRR